MNPSQKAPKEKATKDKDKDKTKEKEKEKDNRSKRAGVRATTGYSRIVGKRRLANGSHQNPKYAVDPAHKMSTISSIADRFMSFMNGETDAERRTRLRLHWYKGFLQAELVIIDRAIQHHFEHGKTLVHEFETQELQLQKWGLLHVLPAFRLQAWCRVSRSALVEEMARLTLRLMKARYDRAIKVIAQFADESSNRKHPLQAYNDFCQMPEDVVAKHQAMSILSLRLARTDRICAAYLNVFRGQLPELEPKSYEQRRLELAQILNEYHRQVMLAHPANIEDTMSWEEFTEWYEARQSTLRRLEKNFASLVEDEREREGRLFRRWCSLALSDGAQDGQAPNRKSVNAHRGSVSAATDNSMGPSAGGGSVRAVESAMMGSAAGTDRSSLFEAHVRLGRGSGKEGSWPADERDSVLGSEPNSPHGGEDFDDPAVFSGKNKMSPKSIVAFIKYFALRVVGARYSIKQIHTETLISLTEALVYRRISVKVYRYSTPNLQEKDLTWRTKCSLCQFVDPTSYGVLHEYAFGAIVKQTVPESGANAAQASDNGAVTGGEDSQNISSILSLREGADGENVETSHSDLPLPPSGLYSSHYSAPIVVEEKVVNDHRSVSVAEAREQLRTASTDQYRTIFSQIAFPPKRTPSTVMEEDENESLGDVRSGRGLGGEYDANFAQLLDGPTFDGADANTGPSNNTSSALDFISRYNKREEGGDDPSEQHSGPSAVSNSNSVSATAAKSGSKSKTSTGSLSAESKGVAHLIRDSVPFAAAGTSPSAMVSNAAVDATAATALYTSLPKPDGIISTPPRNSSSTREHLDNVAHSEVTEKEIVTPNSRRRDPAKPIFSPDMLSPQSVVSSTIDVVSPASTVQGAKSATSTPVRTSSPRPHGTSNKSPGKTGGVEEDRLRMSDTSYFMQQYADTSSRGSLVSASAMASSRLDSELLDDMNGINGELIGELPSYSPSPKHHLPVQGHSGFCDGHHVTCEICREFTFRGHMLKLPGLVEKAPLATTETAAVVSETSVSDATPVPTSPSEDQSNLLSSRNYGKPYARTTKIMTYLSSCVTPKEITFNMLLGLKWLLRDAADLAGKYECIGADVMFPILVLVLVHSKIPCMHLILNILYQYGELDKYGEAEYYTTCLEAAITFIMRMEIPANILEAAAATGKLAAVLPMDAAELDEVSDVKLHDDNHAIAKLGEWLRDQQTMEDTITILQQEGWMV